jgi:hypothetical protein
LDAPIFNVRQFFILGPLYNLANSSSPDHFCPFARDNFLLLGQIFDLGPKKFLGQIMQIVTKNDDIYDPDFSLQRLGYDEMLKIFGGKS